MFRSRLFLQPSLAALACALCVGAHAPAQAQTTPAPAAQELPPVVLTPPAPAARRPAAGRPTPAVTAPRRAAARPAPARPARTRAATRPSPAPAAPRVAAPQIAATPATPRPDVYSALGGMSVPSADIAVLRPRTSDTASLFADTPGMSVYAAGGVSGLPAIRGLADDRLRIKVDGMDLIASCPNHMNPALSYIDPSQVAAAKVWAGVTPVSVGGDSIGGTIAVESQRPVFATPAAAQTVKRDADGATLPVAKSASSLPILVKGYVGAYYRSNGQGFGGNLGATVATENVSVSYAGAYARSDNYKAGGAFKHFSSSSAITRVLPSNEVGSTGYRTTNNQMSVALTHENHLFEIKVGQQLVPKQLYPNQRMDMLKNTAYNINARYFGQFGWGDVDARVYHQTVDHYMDFGADKLFYYGALKGTNGVTYPVGGMPMYTKTKTTGAALKSTINLTQRDLLRVGLDAQAYRLNDWWPPAPDCGVGICAGGMAPLSFWNINNGKRDRLAGFGEWEAKWSPTLLSLLGARVERVTTDTGPVTGYNTATTPLMSAMMKNMYETSSVGTRANFNALDRKRGDTNLDLSAIIRHTPTANLTFELGLAQKARSPNLYERYSWSRATMALEMNNFVGDGNGYLGNPFLKPEVARTASLTAAWKSDDGENELRATPFYTRVHNYIDAVQWNTSANAAAAPLVANQFVIMKYMNQEARLYGVDLSGKALLARTTFGDFGVRGLLNYTNGRNTKTRDGLYNVMPVNGKLALTHRLGGWESGIELAAVGDKRDVSRARNELRLPGYALFNLRTSYAYGGWKISAGVDNLFNKKYYLPLGGAYVGEGATMSFNKEAGVVAPTGGGVSGSKTMWGTGVAGPGRSFYLSANYTF